MGSTYYFAEELDNVANPTEQILPRGVVESVDKPQESPSLKLAGGASVLKLPLAGAVESFGAGAHESVGKASPSPLLAPASSLAVAYLINQIGPRVFLCAIYIHRNIWKAKRNEAIISDLTSLAKRLRLGSVFDQLRKLDEKLNK